KRRNCFEVDDSLTRQTLLPGIKAPFVNDLHLGCNGRPVRQNTLGLEGAFSGRLGATASGLLDGIKASDVGVGFDKFAFAGNDLHAVLKGDHVLVSCTLIGDCWNHESSSLRQVLSNSTAGWIPSTV